MGSRPTWELQLHTHTDTRPLAVGRKDRRTLLISSASFQLRPSSWKEALPTAMSEKKGGPKPPVICYICGRQYGSHSIGIHEPKCLEKFHIENRKLPKSLRRSEPKRPEVVLDENGKVDIEATNEVRWDNAQSLLIPCENCGRRFGEDRLAVHQRSCTADNPAKSIYKNKQKSRSVSSKRNGQKDTAKKWND